jgi:RNA recognition motif-containing protein
MATKLYVGNLSYATTEEQVREVFAKIGEVESVSLITDRYSGESKGFAFVEMAKDEEAKAAIEQADGMVVDGRTIKVSEAKPREDRRPSRGFGHSSGSGGYRSAGGRANSRRR